MNLRLNQYAGLTKVNQNKEGDIRWHRAQGRVWWIDDEGRERSSSAIQQKGYNEKQLRQKKKEEGLETNGGKIRKEREKERKIRKIKLRV